MRTSLSLVDSDSTTASDLLAFMSAAGYGGRSDQMHRTHVMDKYSVSYYKTMYTYIFKRQSLFNINNIKTICYFINNWW